MRTTCARLAARSDRYRRRTCVFTVSVDTFNPRAMASLLSPLEIISRISSNRGDTYERRTLPVTSSTRSTTTDATSMVGQITLV